MKLFRFFYTLFLHLVALALVPKLVLSWKKYKKNFGSRLGINFPRIEKGKDKLIWIHAVSLGETRAVAPLIKRLKTERPTHKIVLSTVTDTGHQEGLKAIPEADWHVFLPFDFPYLIRRIVKKVAPDAVVLTETDFWYHFQQTAKEGGSLLVLINGKLSAKSFYWYKRFPFLVKNLLEPVDTFLLQNGLYKERFKALFLDESKLIVTGNIKLDGILDQTSSVNELVLTLGSTHAPEEELWLSSLKTIWKKFPTLKVMLVPRHPERFFEVEKLIQKKGLSYGKYSSGDGLNKHSLLLVDEMGLLRKLYTKSTLTFVGGSFTKKVGGHNILEPCFSGKPVLFGPYMHAQPDFLDLVKSFDAGVQITEHSLIPVVEQLLSSPPECERLGQNGLKLVQSSKGALEKTLNHLLNILDA